MAKLEQLLANIPDPQLKAELESEVATLKGRVRFGLVYERHLPETVIVGDIDGLKVGDHVRPRAEAHNGHDYRVVALNDQSATVIGVNGASGNGDTTEVPLDELLAVKPFGEPAYLGLASLGTIRRSNTRPSHAVINGENFHALQLLTFLYERQVDCIYIDPPYNTGARDWTYNNRYVDSSDSYRHSKWLSMMEKRLRVAKRLLKPDGVLIVTIDENEIHHLGMLLEELFPQHLRHMITIVISAQGNAKVNFSRVDEYAIFCVPDTGYDVIQGSPIEFLPTHDELDVDAEHGEEEAGDDMEGDHYLGSDQSGPQFVIENARRRGTESLRANRPKMFYPIYIDEQERRVVTAGPPLDLDEEPDMRRVDGFRPIWPIDSNGDQRRWRWGYETMLGLIEQGEIQLGKYNAKRDSWTINRVQPVAEGQSEFKKLKTVWRHTSHAAGTHGSGLLARFLGRGVSFSFPKSVYATRDCLAAVCRLRPNALILDFFAGSGTTLHSTLLMNAADGGNRRCILVTNNELDEKTANRLRRRGVYPGDPEYDAEGIFEAVARPRIEGAITGHRPDGEPIRGSYLGGRPYADGFEENVEFFRLDYLDADQVELGHCFESIHPLVWLAAGGRSERPSLEDDASYLLAPECGYAVLFDEDAFRDFEEALSGADAITHAFIVTDSEEAYAEMRERLGSAVATTMLYRDFLRHFRRRLRA